MSQRTIKATRRQLKRAMGEGAIGVIDAHTHSVQVMQLKIAALEAELVDMRRAYEATIDQVQRIATDAYRLASTTATMTFWQRLRWLLTGAK